MFVGSVELRFGRFGEFFRSAELRTKVVVLERGSMEGTRRDQLQRDASERNERLKRHTSFLRPSWI